MSMNTRPAAAPTQQQILQATLAKMGPEAFTADDYNPGTMRHIVLFRYAIGVSAEQRGQVVERFLALQDRCRRKNGARYILNIETGAQTSGEGADKGLEQGFIVSLKSEGDRNYYVGTPVVTDPRFHDDAHQAFKDFIMPADAKALVSDALVFDFAVEHHTYLKARPA
jgi:hypothetical protein